MRAYVYQEYGSPDVLQLREVPNPIPKKDETLVRILAAGLNPADWHFMRADPHMVRLVTGLRRPRRATIIGSDVSGIVEAIGSSVSRFKPGDAVYAEAGSAAKLQGSCAEYICLPEHQLGHKPPALTFEQAAAVPMAATTAYVGICVVGKVTAGQNVLINGASGGVGTFAVQIAKAKGAQVTAVCSSRNDTLVRSIGADRVIDYAKEDFTSGTARYDVILDAVGNHPVSACRRVLTPRGIYGAIGGGGGSFLGPASHQLRTSLLSPFVGQKLVPVNDRPNRYHDELRTLIESGEVRPVIEQSYSFEDTRAAMAHVETGRVRGKVVVRVAEEGATHD